MFRDNFVKVEKQLGEEAPSAAPTPRIAWPERRSWI
jgi:hypothetical protein